MDEIEQIKKLAGINEQVANEDMFWEMRASLARAVRAAVQSIGPTNEISRKINEALMDVDKYAKENLQSRKPRNIRP